MLRLINKNIKVIVRKWVENEIKNNSKIFSMIHVTGHFISHKNLASLKIDIEF